MPPASPPRPPSAKPTVKEQRTAQRAKKLEEYHRQQKRSARNRRIGIIAGIVVAVAVLALVITSVVLTPQKQSATYTPGGDGATVEGVETFDNITSHVETPVTYEQNPPAGGEHASAWLNCGVYSEPVPNENAVHSLEHGAIWVTYDPSLSASELEKLRSTLPSSYVVLSPYEDLPSPIVLSGWNAQLQVDSADDKGIPAFFEEYWRSDNVPEPGSACTGAIDAPGKVS